MNEREHAERRRHSELREAIDRIAERAAEEAGRRAAKRAAFGYFLLVLVLLVGATVYSRVQEKRLHDGLKASCMRVNTLRLETNKNTQVLYIGVYGARKRERKLANGPGGAAHSQSLVYLNNSLKNLKWTPLTDCRIVIRHPLSYKPPKPRAFTEKYLDIRVDPK